VNYTVTILFQEANHNLLIAIQRLKSSQYCILSSKLQLS